MSVRRPESLGVSPSSFYDNKEAKKYHKSSRIVHIQNEITNRAIELLCLPTDHPGYVLDVGCGSGLSGASLEKAGHYWVGCDISPAMLEVATGHRVLGDDEEGSDDEDEEEESEEEEEEDDGNDGLTMGDLSRGHVSKRQKKSWEVDDEEAEPAEQQEEEEGDEEIDVDSEASDEETPVAPSKPLTSMNDVGDVLESDMGQGLPFRPATFDGVISISALQWLCYSSSSDQDPKLRLNRFFSSLYSVMKRDAKAILQFYPENAEQAYLIAQAASKVGFAGGVLVDYPNSTKAKKYYLCLSFERSYRMPVALGTGQHHGAKSAAQASVFVGKQNDQYGSQKRKGKKSKVLSGAEKLDWIKRKKDNRIRQGKDVKSDSKFTGRKRSRGF
jgi:18S rRNA (guanine1575-N7)-methyltransferase